jgi:hypothetical protein
VAAIKKADRDQHRVREEHQGLVLTHHLQDDNDGANSCSVPLQGLGLLQIGPKENTTATIPIVEIIVSPKDGPLLERTIEFVQIGQRFGHFELVHACEGRTSALVTQ